MGILLAASLLAFVVPAETGFCQKPASTFEMRALEFRTDGMKGPHGEFLFPDWYANNKVEKKFMWPVKPSTFSTTGLAINRKLEVIGYITAGSDGGATPTRSLFWKSMAQYANGDYLPAGQPRIRLVGINDAGHILGNDEGRRDGSMPILMAGRSAPVELELRSSRWKSWRAVHLSREDLVLGTLNEKEGPKGIVLYRHRSGKRSAHAVLETPVEPVAANRYGWIIGKGPGNSPVVLGRVILDGKLRNREQLKDLEPLVWKGPANAILTAINESNDIVGYVPGQGVSQAYLWPAEGLDSQAGTAGDGGIPLGTSSDGFRPAAINEARQIVGSGSGKAMLWENNRLLDLNGRARGNKGWHFHRARSINERGWIVVDASYSPGDLSEGYRRGVVLKPR